MPKTPCDDIIRNIEINRGSVLLLFDDRQTTIVRNWSQGAKIDLSSDEHAVQLLRIRAAARMRSRSKSPRRR